MPPRREPDVPDSMLVDEGMTRRARKNISYNEQISTMRTGDHIVAVLEAAGAVAPSDGAGSSSSTTSSGAAPRGLDLIELAEAVAKRTGEGGKHGKQYQAIRQPLLKLLTAGRVRRRLVVSSGTAHGDTEGALRMLIASSLQIEPDTQAPWSLHPIQLAVGGTSSGGGGASGGPPLLGAATRSPASYAPSA